MAQAFAGLSKLYSHSNRYSFYGRPLSSQNSSVPTTQHPSHAAGAGSRESTAVSSSMAPVSVPAPAVTKSRQRNSACVPISNTVQPMQQQQPAKSTTARTAAAASSKSQSSQSRGHTTLSNNILFEVEYQQENLEYMHMLEKQTMANVELMNVQPELHWFMRPYLVDFLIEIHQSFRLRPETLYLTMNLVDRYVSKRIVYKRHYQLVGCSALLIAAKYEDAKDRVPTVQELSQMCCNAYDPSAFTQMEGHVLSTLGWQLGHPTAESWLRYEYSCAPPTNPATHNVARFLMELTLFHESFLTALPSSIAAGAMLLARHICRDPRPHSHALGPMASTLMSQIHNFIADHLNDLSLILIKKYSYSYYTEASTLVLDWFRKHLEMKKAMEVMASPMNVEMCSSDDDVDSHHSNESVTSIFSTPSRSMNRDEDDDDTSMPLTPLSMHTVQDPSAYAAHAKNATNAVPRFLHSNGSTASRPVTSSQANEKGSGATASWMSLAQLRPVAKYPKATRMDIDTTASDHRSA